VITLCREQKQNEQNNVAVLNENEWSLLSSSRFTAGVYMVIVVPEMT